MEWEKVGLEHLGRDSEDGVTLLDEINERIAGIAQMVVDDRYADEGSISLSLKVKRTSGEAVTIEGKAKASMPSRRKKAVIGIVSNEGEILTQKAVQLHLPNNSITDASEAAKVVEMARAAHGKDESE